MGSLLVRLWRNEDGQDLTEYALLLVLLALAVVGSISDLAEAINGVLSSATTKLSSTT